MKKSKQTTDKNSKNFYAFGNYKPNKNAKPVTYKGKTYLSKAQCMALEGITRKELDAYLNGEVDETPEVTEVVGATEEELVGAEDSAEVNLEDLI